MQHDNDYYTTGEKISDKAFYKTLEQHYAYADDIIKDPDHYARWRIEPATYIMANDFEFWRGNIIKYASRAGFKKYDNKDMRQSEITDLQKIIRYAEMRIEQLESQE